MCSTWGKWIAAGQEKVLKILILQGTLRPDSHDAITSVVEFIKFWLITNNFGDIMWPLNNDNNNKRIGIKSDDNKKR